VRSISQIFQHPARPYCVRIAFALLLYAGFQFVIGAAIMPMTRLGQSIFMAGALHGGACACLILWILRDFVHVVRALRVARTFRALDFDSLQRLQEARRG